MDNVSALFFSIKYILDFFFFFSYISMATTTTLKQRAQSEVLYNPSNGYITPLGIEFPNGSVMTTAPNRASIAKITFPASVTSGMGNTGVGSYNPPAQTFNAPIYGPNVLVEYQVEVGGDQNTIIANGETPTLYANGTALYSDGSTQLLNSKVQPVTSVLAQSQASYVSLSQPLYFGTTKQLTGFQIEFYLFGPFGAPNPSTNYLTIGECVVDVFYGSS